MVITQQSSYISLKDLLPDIKAAKKMFAEFNAGRSKEVIGYDQNSPVTRGAWKFEILSVRRAWLGEGILLPGHQPPEKKRSALRAKHFALFLREVANSLEERGLLEGGELPIMAAARYVRETPRRQLEQELGYNN